MMTSLVTFLLWFEAIGCGIMAGIYFAFSVFIMASLSKITPQAGIAAMQSINLVIVRTFFLPLFFGTSLGALVLVIVAAIDWGSAGSLPTLSGGAIYVAGMFLCTVFLNVPLNNKLAAVDPATEAGANVWVEYLKKWTRWNHIRTWTSTLASGLFIAALIVR